MTKSPAGVAPEVDESLTYLSYLQVPELLALQRLRSEPPHPEELHFIVVHQSLELWFKLLLADLERIIAALDADDHPAALVLLRRVNDVMANGLDQMRSLHAMPPWSLQEFRSYLGTASGLQSVQFRELEVLSGLRDPSYLKSLEILTAGSLPEAVQQRLQQRSLAEAFRSAGARLGIEDWAELYVEAVAEPGVGARDADLARRGFYLVCEALVDYDERWLRWRHEHVVLVARTLGARTRGTAGTAISYLERTLRYRYFPELWDLRNDLSLRGGGELVG